MHLEKLQVLNTSQSKQPKECTVQSHRCRAAQGRGSPPLHRYVLDFEEKFLEPAKDLEKLRNNGSLLFQQVPMVEIDGMKLVQTRAILNYIASKYNLCGKDIKERAPYMYTEGRAGLSEKLLHYSLHPPEEKDAKLALIKEGTTSHYFPVFETVLKSHEQDYLIGNKLSQADIHLVKLLYHVEELDSSLISNFPLLKAVLCALRALKIRISKLPTVKKFLQPGSLRKLPINAKGLEEATKIFNV
ncbi:glutathione S-transferase A3-like [Gorilla gorilla gorilla]|uniref:glutathione S-transferase A3-like n=1 Tax=Gorilla gorilla gorilla TaxID=9595 RepID=UPI002445D0D2|nr:glutathione S-transferase A3-like [Gorilla gorilla gorilla]